MTPGTALFTFTKRWKPYGIYDKYKHLEMNRPVKKYIYHVPPELHDEAVKAGGVKEES